MAAWLFTIELPLYLPPAVDRILAAHGESVERVVFAEAPMDLLVRQQYRKFGPSDGLRMVGRYAKGGLLGLLPAALQRRLTGRLHSVADAAAAHGVPVESVDDVADPSFVDRVRAADPEMILSFVCAQRLPPSLLAVPDWPINLHPSLLPAYRGPAPQFWALYHDETETGWTAHVMVEEFDAGPIIEQRRLPIVEGDSVHSLTRRLAALGADLAVDVLDAFPEPDFTTRPNETTAEDYYPMPGHADRREFKRRGNRLV